MEDFVGHLLSEHLGDVGGIVVAQQGQIDAPEGWILESTTVCNGKRIRTYRITDGA